MPNGRAVALPHELEAPSTSEVEIGEAAAAAAVAIGLGVAEFATKGQITANARTAGGEALVRVAMLQLAFFGDDGEFARIIRREGSRALWRHAGFREHAAALPPAVRDHLFEEFLAGVVEISAKVVADERALGQH
jgi:hypothetical protein